MHVIFWINREPSGKPLGIWGVVNDLSGQREVERQVAMTMEQYRFLADNSEDVIWALNDRMEYIYVSPSVERLRGFTPEELLGTCIADSMTPESFNETQLAARKNRDKADGDDLSSERLVLELKRKDGSTVWAEVMARGMRDTNGRWLGVVGSSRDITARRRVEKKLKTNEEYLKVLVSANNDSVGLYTPEGAILTINRKMATALDADPEKIAGQSVFDYVPNEHEAEARDLFAMALETRAPVIKEVVWSGRLLEANIYPLRTMPA